MRIVIRLVLAVVLLLVLAVAGGVSYLYASYPDVPAAATAVSFGATPDRLARGQYLAEHVAACLDCHSKRDWSRFAGPVTPGTEGTGGERFDHQTGDLPGSIHAKNITPAALGDWTDGELLRAVTEGVSRDGTALFPLMPYPNFGRLSQDDVYAILAYIRTLVPIESHVPERTLDLPMNLIVRTLPAPAAFVTKPSASDPVAYGEYMVRAAGCAECHTPMDGQGQRLPGMQFAGGMVFRHPDTNYRAFSANITPDATTGIGAMTSQQFVDKFKGFDGPDDRVLDDAGLRQFTPMPWRVYAGMTRDDLAAIYAYLRSQKPVVHRVQRHPDAASTR